MTDSNIGLASVVSDPFGKTATAIMQEVLSSEVIDDAKLSKLIHGSCKNKDKILDSLLGSKIETDQRFKMKESMSHMQELLAHIQACELEMVKRVLPMMSQCKQISELKGFGLISAIIVISEIGIDMNQFESDKQLACWAGRSPANNESAKKKKSVRISKAGQYLKPLLVQCALAAIKDKESYFGLKYSRIKKHRGHKKAIIAIARMLLVSIYHMLLTGEVFNPSDIESFKNPKPNQPVKLTPDIALKFLQQSGYYISSIQLPYPS